MGKNITGNNQAFRWSLDFYRKIRMYHVAVLIIIYGVCQIISEFLWTPHDPRTIDWFLVRNPIYLLIILMTYLYFIQYLGPKLMKDRNPFDLSRLIMIFNVTQIVYNVWMFNEVFFVLRKKNNQITPLHLVHHFGMPFLAFGCVRFFPGGHITLTGLLNTFIHSIMYFYYFIAGLGPSFKKYLWWKQYLTLLQMIQFLIISIHSSIIVLSDCDFAKRQISFYRQTYMKKTS
uniref:Elongation of very long chain fatty acids protein n=1 Tax=Timema tahoe TaxID=61484 RepID=A0A7R9IC28_9NEOP|nr:unnamed protein product [Timema tahoe]